VTDLNKKTIIVDIDGTLTKETKGHDYASRTPRKNIINKVNKLYRNHNIILWTSRLGMGNDKSITKKWLKENNVKYNQLIFGKRKYDLWVDDMSKKPEELL